MGSFLVHIWIVILWDELGWTEHYQSSILFDFLVRDSMRVNQGGVGIFVIPNTLYLLITFLRGFNLASYLSNNLLCSLKLFCLL